MLSIFWPQQEGGRGKNRFQNFVGNNVFRIYDVQTDFLSSPILDSKWISALINIFFGGGEYVVPSLQILFGIFLSLSPLQKSVVAIIFLLVRSAHAKFGYRSFVVVGIAFFIYIAFG